ncbi:FMN-binding negative transcriptional regulator [Nonomuraea zeae]|uniref:FMN-binding negative transcriptional regulator n=1 Tax=Nonomuraea zeae TaxID=1642303 RepID=A0A5S4GMQ3_9ACTN|nr:FMN-binding negative transcriptional regulator [Nonomuraea zeae]TMR33861.1 FMN-binding negative transcriptional regulator [Nonomuraea zeae]
MHTFPRYAAPGPEHVADLVTRNPFALVVTSADGVPAATHVPVVVERLEEGRFEGGTLLGHMARANPHWRSWEQGTQALVVFSGPHGYVSPTVYATDPAVPTWDYAAVHLTGRVELLDDALEVVERTVAAAESLRAPAWEPTPASRERFRALLPGVVAFRVHVRTEQSMFKLSQDIDAERYARVRDSFAAENSRLADLMDRS